MKLGVIIYSNEPETVWNALRLANYSLGEKDDVTIFLLAKGVEMEQLDNDIYKVTEQMVNFTKSGGRILVCGTCLKIRKSECTEMCSISSMKDLYQLIEESDRVVTF